MSRALGLIFLAGALVASCSREAPDVRDARRHAERYLQALARGDLSAIRENSTCVVATESFRGGNVLRIGDARLTSEAVLESLAARAAVAHRSIDSLWQRASEEEADSLFRASRAAARRQIVYRNALRAAARSAGVTKPPPGASLEIRELRVRTRYGGPLVGPKPVDREQVLRMVRVPPGRWIVFSMYLIEDDPRPPSI